MDWVGFASLPSLLSTFHAPAADAGATCHQPTTRFSRDGKDLVRIRM